MCIWTQTLLLQNKFEVSNGPISPRVFWKIGDISLQQGNMFVKLFDWSIVND